MNINLVQLLGRLTKDPELRTTPSGANVVKFGLATNYTFKDKNGEKKDTTQFHNCVAWGKAAELIHQYMKKGGELYVSGRIEYRSWDKPDGTKGYMTEIVVDEFQFGAKAKEAQPMEHRTAAAAISEESYGGKPVDLDSIPF